MTVVLCDSIQAKPLPISRAIIHAAVTRLVTNIRKNKFLHRIVSETRVNALTYHRVNPAVRFRTVQSVHDFRRFSRHQENRFHWKLDAKHC